jgi:hypothetical protein
MGKGTGLVLEVFFIIQMKANRETVLRGTKKKGRFDV